MSDLEWRVINCPECAAKFKAPAAMEDGASFACPSCGAEILSEPEKKPSSSRPATLPERRSDPLEVVRKGTEPVRDLNPGRSALPPAPEKSVSIDLSGLTLRDANRKPFEAKDEATAPLLDNLDKIASTEDEEFAAVDEEPRRRVTSKYIEEEIVGWDDDEETKRSASRSTVASTFKLVLLALPVLIGVGIFAMNAQPKKNTRSSIDEAAIAAAAGALAGSVEQPPEPDLTSPMELREEIGNDAFLVLVREAATKFLQAQSLDERVASVRHRDRVRPLMERYYQKHPLEPLAFEEIAPNDRYHIERGFVVTGLTLPGFDSLPIVLSREGDALLVDWESFVGYGEMELEEFIQSRPTQPVLMRLRARPDDYYNYQFDEEGYHCIKLSDLKFSKFLYGYFEKGSPTAEKFFNRMAKENGIDFVILKIHFPPNPKSDDQVIIHEFIDVGWLLRG